MSMFWLCTDVRPTDELTSPMSMMPLSFCADKLIAGTRCTYVSLYV